MKRLDESDQPYSGIGRANMSRFRTDADAGAEELELTREIAPKVVPSDAAMTAARRMVAGALGQDGQGGTQTAPELPAHVKTFLSVLVTHFAQAADAREWDQHDEIHYARQVLMLTREQTRDVFRVLRERHTFRPSVAEVKTVVGEMTGIHTDPLPGNVADSRRTVAAPVADPTRKQIEGANETPGYLRFRSMLRGKVDADKTLKWKKRDTE